MRVRIIGEKMKVSIQNLGIYSINNIGKQKSFGCSNCLKTMGVENQLPNPALYADLDRFDMDWQKQEELGNEYYNKIYDVCFDSDGKLDERLKCYLDNTKFDIATSNGEIKKMTIKEAVTSSIIRDCDVDTSLYHATWTTEVADKIIKNGFDVNKISRTQFGPGFYFSSSYGSAREYNSAVLKADCKGKCAIVDGPYFDRITESSATSDIASFIGLSSNGYGTAKHEHNVARRVLYEYTRNMIIDELGYDMAYGSSRFDSCYAVYNPKAISNVRFD